jgi:hypothetical protein
LPADVLAYGALLVVGVMAFLSGVLFAGLLSRALLNALRRAGVVKDQPPAPMARKVYPIFLLAAGLLAVVLAIYLRGALRGPAIVHVGGAADSPYDYPLKHGDIAAVSAEGTLREVTSRYTGVPVRELVASASPRPNASLLLIRASDGYAFFVSMDEVRESDSLLLAPQGDGKAASYDLVGARNSKAWVRGVKELLVVGSATLEVKGALAQPAAYDPDEWQFDMDSVRIDVGGGPQKLQGVPLGQVLKAMEPLPEATTVLLHAAIGPVSLPLSGVLEDDDVRIFTVIGEADVTFAVARMDGTVLAAQVTEIEVR